MRKFGFIVLKSLMSFDSKFNAEWPAYSTRVGNYGLTDILLLTNQMYIHYKRFIGLEIGKLKAILSRGKHFFNNATGIDMNTNSAYYPQNTYKGNTVKSSTFFPLYFGSSVVKGLSEYALRTLVKILTIIDVMIAFQSIVNKDKSIGG